MTSSSGSMMHMKKVKRTDSEKLQEILQNAKTIFDIFKN